MPEHGLVVKAWRHAMDGEQVRAADRGGRHLHHRVPGILQLRLGNVDHANAAVLAGPDRSHPGSSISTRYPSGSTQKKRLPPHGGRYIPARNGTPRPLSATRAASASSTSSTS